MTWSCLTRPAGYIRQSALRTLELDWLVFTGAKKPPPHPPTELWLVCRELVENLEKRIRILKGFSCQIFRRFHTVNEAIRRLFDETHNIKLKVKNLSYNEKLKEDY